ncbi:hypothetical protein COLO4_06156 [Corchorus olitorius]|uniref:Uncharacterized protein n=1 Tax=Corchorus olitorius TaxID=93759 RepID=A0A1R3KNU6_9ROSI|nr:hypothetical protein COLO4_06156 [Corchorus olitorius]
MLHFISSLTAGIILGEAMIPCILLALGGNLVDGKNFDELQPFMFYFAGPGPRSSRISLRTLVAIIFGRLRLVPPAGLGIKTLADKLGFLPPDDKMFCSCPFPPVGVCLSRGETLEAKMESYVLE